MSVLDDLADQLARDAITVTKKTGDDNIISEINNILEASSSTMQEAFNTAVRVHMAEERARKFLKTRLKAALAAKE